MIESACRPWAFPSFRFAHVNGVVVEQGIGADQAVDDALDLWHVEDGANARALVALGEWGAGGGAPDASGIDFGHHRAVDLARDQRVEAQEASSYELRHLG